MAAAGSSFVSAAVGNIGDIDIGGIDAAAASSGATDAPTGEADSSRRTLKEQIQRLKEQQKVLKAEKEQNRRDIKNAQKRNKRLKARVVGLTDEDLVAVLRERACAARAKASA